MKKIELNVVDITNSIVKMTANKITKFHELNENNKLNGNHMYAIF